METFGWTMPVLVDEDGLIIAGHARVLAAKKLKLTEAPCIVATGWSDAKKEAYQITDNRLSELSDWDSDILGDQIKRINAEQFDMTFLNMDAFELDVFKPTLDPKIDTSAVTGEQVAKTKAGLDGQFSGKEPPKEYTCTCPHCGEDFDIQI